MLDKFGTARTGNGYLDYPEFPVHLSNHIEAFKDIGRQFISSGREITSIRRRYAIDGKPIYGSRGWKEANTSDEAKTLERRYRMALEEVSGSLTIQNMECAMAELVSEYKTRNAEATKSDRPEPYDIKAIIERAAKLPSMAGWKDRPEVKLEEAHL